MLTKRQNMLETIKGGHPDRFVKQFEALGIVYGTPIKDNAPKLGEPPVQDSWGVWRVWPEGVVSNFPVHDDEHVVVKDIEHWQDYVKGPSVKFSEAEWEPFIAWAESIDRNEQFVMAARIPGLFERAHFLCEIQKTLIYFYEYPDELEELLKYIKEWNLEYAEAVCDHLKPDGVFSHDDWGTKISTFMAPDMFGEFIYEPQKEIYQYYKDHTSEGLVVHHSDTYGVTLIPYMIDMGIDVWQGCLQTNDLPAVIEKYGDKITFMGGIESGEIDREDATEEEIEAHVLKICEECGPMHYIPCCTRGGAGSLYEHVYPTVDSKIDLATELMKEKHGWFTY